MWTNYNLCFYILNYNFYFTNFAFNIKENIIDNNMIKAMIFNNPMIVFKYNDDERFFNDENLFVAICNLQDYIYYEEFVLKNGVPSYNEFF